MPDAGGSETIMLARVEKYRCIECNLPYGADRFRLYGGRIENGPAYWCDRRLPGSPRCLLAHDRKRAAEGTLTCEPAPEAAFSR